MPVSILRQPGSRVFLKLALTLVLCWAVFSSTGFSVADLVSKGGTLENVVLVIVILVAQLVITAKRWDVVLRSIGFSIPLRRVIRFRFMGIFAGLALPASVGPVLTQVMLPRADGARMEQAVVAAMLDRLLALMALVIFGLAGLPFLLDRVSDVSISTSLIMFGAAAVMGGAAMLMLVLGLGQQSDSRAARAIRAIHAATVEFLARPVSGAASLLLSLVAIFLGVLAIYVLLSGAGAEVTLVESCFILPPVMLLSSLPIAIGGWGVREGSMIVALSLIGIDSATALAVSVQFGILNTILGLAGGVFWLPYLAHRKSSKKTA